MTRWPPREVILASAGSGKTYQLTLRLVRLLAEGAEPRRIAALTFSRAAAGEFNDAVVALLSRAAQDPGRAQRLEAELGGLRLPASRVRQLLRAWLEAGAQLRLGTLDAFFFEMARLLAAELGPGDAPVLLDAAAAESAAREVRQRVLVGTSLPDEERRDLAQAFKRATLGREEKRIDELLAEFVESAHDLWREAPAETVWEGPPTGPAPAPGTWPEVLGAAVEALRAGVTTEAQTQVLDGLQEDLRAWPEVRALGRSSTKTLIGNLFRALRDQPGGPVEVTVQRRKVVLAGPARAALERFAADWIVHDVAARRALGRGLHALLAAYDRAYAEAVRDRGRWRFADLPRELVGAVDGPAGRAEARDRLYFRLDGRIDHWLFDEFQDTSPLQWAVVSDLVDEAVQDPEGRRTFFSVGDLKQAIYGWRGGDERLFGRILGRYGPRLEQRALARSFRSRPAVIDLVNRVFGAEVLMGEATTPAVAARWAMGWTEHVSARPDRPGFVAVQCLGERSLTTRLPALAERLAAVRPLERGWTCAVLVPRNEDVRAVVDHLRAVTDLPVEAESVVHPAVDHPSGLLLLDLIRAVLHPADTRAWFHLEASPLGRWVRPPEGSRDEVARSVLRRWQGSGAEAALEPWITRMAEALAPEDRFSRARLGLLRGALRRFDLRAESDLAELVPFLAGFNVPSSSSASAIQVMTVHKSKGLGFDWVLVPQVDSVSWLQPRQAALAVARDAEGRVEWIVPAPRRDVAEHHEPERRWWESAVEDAAYGDLCALYVALTRAREACHVFVPPCGREPTHAAAFLRRTLGLPATVGAEVTWGDPNWSQTGPAAPPTVRARPGLRPIPDGLPAPTRRARRLPSEGEGAEGAHSEERPGAILRAEADTRARDFGTEVHGWLERIEWWEPGQPWPWDRAGVTSLPSESARRMIEAWLQAEAVGPCWRQPPGGEVWRERSFDAVVGEDWVTGVFDRVVLERGAEGRVRRAAVYDFKTGGAAGADRRAADAVAHERYAHQLGLYRTILARMVGLDPAAVTAHLVLPDPPRLVDVVGWAAGPAPTELKLDPAAKRRGGGR